MSSSFDIPGLKTLLKDFNSITGLRTTIFDENFQEIASYPNNVPTFCRLIRSSQIGRENCRICDQNAFLKSKNSLRAFTYQCHSGLTEAIAPIILRKSVIGYIMFGHIASYRDVDEGKTAMRNKCREYPIDLELLNNTYAECQYYPEEYISSATRILTTVAAYISISHMATLKRDSLPIQIDKYISSHLTDELTSTTLCEQFDISRTTLYLISKKNFGMGISEYIRSLKITEATHILKNTDMPINQVAATVGINDYNYFTRVFKKQIGLTPRDYKKL